MITPVSSIPEILKIASHCFSKSELNEVQQILMDREKTMKMELEDLRRDADSMRTEARLQERSHSIAEMEKLRVEEKLQKVQRTCEELNEKIARLTEESKVSCDRAKRAEERHEALSKEFSQMLSEKNKALLELNGKINELQRKNEQLVGKYEELRHEKMASDQLVVELKREKCEASRSLDELRREKTKCEDRIENLAPRVMAMETELANLLNVKAEDLASLSDFVDKFSPKEEKVDLPDIIKRWKCTNGDAEDVGTCKSTASDDTPLVMKGCRESVTPRAAATEVIEICDSDDEARPGDMSDLSSGQNKRKITRPVKDMWYSSAESD